jgi:hypothetical protein
MNFTSVLHYVMLRCAVSKIIWLHVALLSVCRVGLWLRVLKRDFSSMLRFGVSSISCLCRKHGYNIGVVKRSTLRGNQLQWYQCERAITADTAQRDTTLSHFQCYIRDWKTESLLRTFNQSNQMHFTFLFFVPPTGMDTSKLNQWRLRWS